MISRKGAKTQRIREKQEGVSPLSCCLSNLVSLRLCAFAREISSSFAVSASLRLCGLTLLLLCATQCFAEQLAILPGDFTLDGPAARQGIVVEKLDDDGEHVEQLVEGLVLESNNPEVARVEENSVVPVANGKAVISAKSGRLSAETTVTVVGLDRPWDWSFRNHVQSVLTKTGCNSGACHGALAGKGGLKLSLRAYDTQRDWRTLTREAQGRRIDVVDPGRSLILIKPTGAVPHKGGVRFEVDSPEYRVLAEWIAAGASQPRDEDARLEKLEILPKQVLLSKDAKQQFLVRAHFTDGRVEDVTRWAKFTAANEAVASVDDTGKATVVGYGEGAVSAYYLSQLVIAQVTAPYPNKIDPAVFKEASRRNFIDELVLEKLERLNLPPSPPASDQEFLRRAYLDIIGVLPTKEECLEFYAETSADKRDRLIESLLERPEFVDYWAYKWSDLFLVNGRRLRPDAVTAYYKWIRQCVADNKPWDELAREVVTSIGESMENGATNFYSLHQDPFEMTENTCVAFLGLNLNCARCHNHPLEKWTNDQYYAMANLFARVRGKGWGGNTGTGDGRRTVFVVAEGDFIQPSTGKPQPPAPLDAEPMTLEDPADRRVYLAKWLTSPENPYFSRAIANRVWANFFDVGIVEPVDDLRVSNPATNEELLTALGKHLAENKFDLKALMRAILQSETYRRASKPLSENEAEKRYYSHYYPRRLMAEVMLDSISQATDVPTDFTEMSILGPGGKRLKTKEYARGTRALQLKDAAVFSPFLKTFGRNERMITCDCERSSEPSMVQALHLANGETVNDKLAAKDNRIDQMLAAGKTNYEIIEDIFWRALSRQPTDDEMLRLMQSAAPTKETPRRELLEDVYWGVLSSREFLFNH
jgi:hypothetical protein